MLAEAAQFTEKKYITKEILIPEEVARLLTEGCDRVLEQVAKPIDRPDALIVLLRAAAVYVPSLQARANKKGIALPPLLFAHIGHTITDRGPALGDEISLYSGMSEQEREEESNEYRIWVTTDTECREIASNLKMQADRFGITGRQPLIIDDIQRTTNTQTAAQAIIQEAFNTEATPGFTALFGFKDTISNQIISTNFPELAGNGGAFVLLQELLKGYTVQGGTLIPITTSEDIQFIVDQIQKKTSYKKIYRGITALQSDTQLLSFRAKVIKALADVTFSKE